MASTSPPTRFFHAGHEVPLAEALGLDYAALDQPQGPDFSFRDAALILRSSILFPSFDLFEPLQQRNQRRRSPPPDGHEEKRPTAGGASAGSVVKAHTSWGDDAAHQGDEADAAASGSINGNGISFLMFTNRPLLFHLCHIREVAVGVQPGELLAALHHLGAQRLHGWSDWLRCRSG